MKVWASQPHELQHAGSSHEPAGDANQLHSGTACRLQLQLPLPLISMRTSAVSASYLKLTPVAFQSSTYLQVNSRQARWSISKAGSSAGMLASAKHAAPLNRRRQLHLALKPAAAHSELGVSWWCRRGLAIAGNRPSPYATSLHMRTMALVSKLRRRMPATQHCCFRKTHCPAVSLPPT